MHSLLGALNDSPLILPQFDLIRRPEYLVRSEESARRQTADRRAVEHVPNVAQGAEVLPLPYLALLRSLIEQGRILDARNLLEVAGEAIPRDSKVRQVLASPRIRKNSVLGVDRSPEFRWLKTNADVYRGRWVALDGESLIASSDSLKELLAQLRAHPSQRRPLIHRIE